VIQISARQLEAFEAQKYAEFEARTAEWLQKHFPSHCHLLGANDLRERIRLGLQIAALQGFHARAEGQKFIYLMFLFGRDFDVCPAFDWLRKILRQSEKAPALRMKEAFSEIESRYRTGALSAED
jgi:hypothetical protein